jgi:DNA-directed RNA polymerase specialized sigma24 family protein
MTAEVDTSLQRFSLDDLGDRCREETRRYRQSQPNDTRYCLEIVRRALRLAAAPGAARPLFSDEPARELLVRLYTSFIEANISRQIPHDGDFEDLVQQVWARFWSAAANGLDFRSLEEALAYLKRATVSTLISHHRQRRKRWRDDSLQQQVEALGDGAMADANADLFAGHVRERFRERCRSLIGDPLDYRIFVLRYGVGLPPRAIAAELAAAGMRLRDREPTPRAVSDVLERLFRRLRQDPDIQDLMRED